MTLARHEPDRPAPLPRGAQPSGATADRQSERALIVAAQAGDAAAFEALVAKYQTRIYRHCQRMVGDEHQSHDLTQDVILRLFQKIRQYRFTYAFYTWVYRITANCCIDHLRKVKRLRIVSQPVGETGGEGEEERALEIPDVRFCPEAALQRQELGEVLSAAIARLPETLQMAVLLRDVEGFRYHEIADLLGWTHSAVKSRLHQARTQLREALAGYVN